MCNILAYSIGNCLQSDYGGLIRRDTQFGMEFWFIDMGILLEDFYPKMCQEQSVENHFGGGALWRLETRWMRAVFLNW